MGFERNGIRTIDYEMEDQERDMLRIGWKKYLASIPPYNGSFGKGIVYTAGGVRYSTCAVISIKVLRSSGCQLPIELWYIGEELSKDMVLEFGQLGVECRNFQDLGIFNISGFPLKPLAMIHSSFKEILFLDADNNCVADPTYLFASKEYQDFGAIFWPDFWNTERDNPIWSIVQSESYEYPEQESGQLLVDKQRCWTELNLALHFNIYNEIYYKLLHGDKDTFKFAWLAMKKDFYMIPYSPGCCGYIKNDIFIGTTMVQHDPDGNILFLHRNLLKWDVTKEGELAWEVIKKHNHKDIDNRFYVFNSSEGHIGFDLGGDVSRINFREQMGDYENRCLDFLKEWKASETYRNFLDYCHIQRYRTN